MARRLLFTALLALSAGPFLAPAYAQRAGDVPRRPRLAAAADSNDARAYMALAEQKLEDQPREAADAFYWAYQLEPSSANALYGRYAALLTSNPQRLVDYWNGERRVVRSREVLAIDSLYFRALTMNPFLHRVHENQLFRVYMYTIARQGFDRAGGVGSVSEGDVMGWIHSFMQHRAASWLLAEEAYASGRHPDALRHYGEAIEDARRGRSWLRADRARLHAHMGNNAGAMADFTQAIQDMRTEDERNLVYLYQSKALLEHSLGSLHERMGDRDAAREAYGRALTEDLAFYPAHVRLGMLALAGGDTTTALGELDLAAQAGEPHVVYTYGAVLAQLGKLDEAAQQLERVMAMTPHWAEPYFVMGAVRDGQADLGKARAAYEGFLARAARGHRRRATAEARVADLQVGADAAAAQPAGAR
jgi:tetratricopeptide (TPR) repeat protein